MNREYHIYNGIKAKNLQRDLFRTLFDANRILHNTCATIFEPCTNPTARMRNDLQQNNNHPPTLKGPFQNPEIK